MRSVVSPPRCHEASGPPCDALVHDPETVFGDPDQWPEHFCCDAVARQSTRQWAARKARGLYGDQLPPEVRAWIHTWPLPVGAWSLPDDVPEALAVLPGYGLAALILEPAIPFVTVAAFGLVSHADGFPVDMQFTTVGWNDDRADTFRARAAKWWNGENSTGAPHGPTFTRMDAMDAYLAYHEKMGVYPTQLQLAFTDELGCSERTVWEVTKPWKCFERDAKAWREHRRSLPTRRALRAKRQTRK